MVNQMKAAKMGQITEEMKIVANEEDESPKKICRRVAAGSLAPLSVQARSW